MEVEQGRIDSQNDSLFDIDVDLSDSDDSIVHDDHDDIEADSEDNSVDSDGGDEDGDDSDDGDDGNGGCGKEGENTDNAKDDTDCVMGFMLTLFFRIIHHFNISNNAASRVLAFVSFLLGINTLPVGTSAVVSDIFNV